MASFVSGGVGGVCSIAVGYPFDLVKVRMQTSSPSEYKSSIDCFSKTIKQDGFRGLYRGALAPMVGVAPLFAVCFWGYDIGKDIIKYFRYPDYDKNPRALTLVDYGVAGFISAIPSTILTAPFERIKVILQLQAQPSRQFTGALDVASHLYRTGGLNSLFKGSVATLVRDGPNSALYFATYEYVKQVFANENGDVSLTGISLAGGMAGVLSWIPVFPIDTVKSHLQASNSPNLTFKEITNRIYAQGGIRAFFPGLGPTLVRSFPASAATFVGYELCMDFFKKYI
ncbi:mitochondrial inner membrane carnitine transporter [Nadsonia fulvescens var. elongata DSM 6958]|uniref:Mitochondrial inner membrane carnitine transporter n=1 Tax=Nadsonia fulvescens var. elongata DSM 6958 TaxID=857566 RepID=A0A1E3PPS0_9ASCO|nr:mitochondrial inner membrane carnitine transporter [Nadsonia fulvescens var. elongata DSM 6958]